MLKELKVIELASVLAGPSVGQFFAELGAEVIKIENPNTGGDVTRSWKLPTENEQNISSYFSCINWGKKSVVLDLKDSKNLPIIYQLLKEADMVITSFKPGDAEKLHLDYATVKTKNEQIIYGQISGYGAIIDRVGYDAIIQAEVGFMYMNGESGTQPLKMPVALMDIIAGHQLKESLLIGYIHLLKTGKGSFHEVSLIEAGLSALANQATNFLVAGQEPEKKGSLHPNIAPYGEVFISEDNIQCMLAIGNDKQFSHLLSILNLKNQPQYNTNALRVRNRENLHNYLQEAIYQWKIDKLLNACYKNGIPIGKINKVSEAINIYSQFVGLFKEGYLAGLKTFIAHSPLYNNISHILPPPKLGQHTNEVLGRMSK